MPVRSLTLRLALLSALASTAVLLGAGSLIGMRVQAHFVETDLAEMHGKLELVRHMLGRVASRDELAAVPTQLADALVGHGHLALAVVAGPQRSLFRTPRAPFPAELLGWPPQPPADAVEWEVDGRAYLGIGASATTAIAGQEPLTVAVALDTEHHREFMAAFRASLGIALLGGIVSSALLGWAVARAGLLPLLRLSRALRGISAGRLDQRLPTAAMPAELAELGRATNQMLERLQESFARLSNYSSDIAHELRTPVSNLMLQTQVAASKPRSADEYRELLYANLEEFERLARMIGDMLFLAQADNGLALTTRSRVDLAEELRALFGFYEALADEQGVRLALDGDGHAEGDAAMIRRALGNLLANAIRHTPRGATLTAALTTRPDGGTRLQMRNPGTIAPEHLPRLFDRFYRVDDSRQAVGTGAGLGLAITHSIVAAHGGTICADCASGEIRFTIDWPHGLETAPPASRATLGNASRS